MVPPLLQQKSNQATKFVLGKIGDDFLPQKTGQKTGKESLPSDGSIHKLSIASKRINEKLEAREFSNSTQWRTNTV